MHVVGDNHGRIHSRFAFSLLRLIDSKLPREMFMPESLTVINLWMTKISVFSISISIKLDLANTEIRVVLTISRQS